MSHSNSESSKSSTGPVFRPLLSSTSLGYVSVDATIDEDDRGSPSESPMPMAAPSLALSKTGRIITVLYTCLVAVLGTFSIGYVLGFPSSALLDLDENTGKYTRMNKSIYHSMFNVSRH